MTSKTALPEELKDRVRKRLKEVYDPEISNYKEDYDDNVLHEEFGGKISAYSIGKLRKELFGYRIPRQMRLTQESAPEPLRESVPAEPSPIVQLKELENLKDDIIAVSGLLKDLKRRALDIDERLSTQL
jgi:hypothetical protein